MKLLPKSLIIAYIFLSSIASFGFIFLNRVTFKSLIKSKFTSNSVDIELSKENDKQWAKEISNGGYILLFRHAERDKWVDVGVYDALESDMHDNGPNNTRFGENEYFANAVCLNAKGKIQAKAMKEVIDYSKLPIGYVISSPICRSRQTANIAFGGYEALHRDLVYKGPFTEENRSSKLTNLMLSLPIYENTNTVISGHNVGSDCEVFAGKGCNLKLEEGGFYVIKKDNGKLKLVYEFNNFQNYSSVFFKR